MGFQTAVKETASKIGTKRADLTVSNKTATYVDPGRPLSLIWREDVHGEYDETPLLDVDASDKKESKGIGNGDNCRGFKVEVYKVHEDKSSSYIGYFRHYVYSPAFSNGGSEHTEIYAEYQTEEDRVLIYREYRELTIGCPDNPVESPGSPPRTEDIGFISTDDWLK